MKTQPADDLQSRLKINIIPGCSQKVLAFEIWESSDFSVGQIEKR